MNDYRSYQKLGNQLKLEIASGGYAVEEKFLTEREIAEKYCVSRSLVREALIMLEIEDLIIIRKGSGIYIKAIPDYLSVSNASNDHGPFEILQARQVFESATAACAAIYATKTDISELRNILHKERENIDTALQGEENDRAFHIRIAQATQNDMMASTIENIWNTRIDSPMWDKLHEHIDDQSFRHKWLVDHEKILNALQRRDAELARKEMWQHLENVKNTLMELSDFDDPHFDGYLFESIPYETIFEKTKES